MINGQINEEILYSEYLQEEVPLLIYMPDTYMPMQTYQLLIASDGRDYFQYGKLGAVVQELMDESEIEDTIVVGIPYQDKYIRREMYHPEGEKQAAYIRFVAEELLPFLEERFSLEKDREARGLIGDSLAATVSLMIATTYPHLFSRVAMHSPFSNETVIEAVTTLDDTLPFTFYHVIGTEEHKVATTGDGIQNFLEPNRELHRIFQKKQSDYFFEEFEGNHTWKYWQKDVPRAVYQMFQ